MGSKTSKAKRLSPAETKTVVPSIPQEIVDEILDHLATSSDFRFRSLQSCALVSKLWVPSCRRHLFRTILFTSKDMARWLKAFPVLEESPAHHVRHLRFKVGWYHKLPEEFFEHIPWFTNVERMTLSGDGTPFWMNSFWRSPPSVTSVAIDVEAAPMRVQAIMAQLPNLDSLSLSGLLAPFVAVDWKTSPGIGTILRGRFGGRLRLANGYVCEDIMNMLLEIPTGVHFTEVQIGGRHEYLPLTVNLAEACAETLVKLSYTISSYCGHKTLERSFDLSKLPNLEEVDFGVSWVGGGLLWIHTALSTLRPATSPRLSAVQLNFTRSPITNQSVETAIEETGNDLRQIAAEVARIECEFKGAANFTVVRDPWFKVVLDALDILQHVSETPEPFILNLPVKHF